MPNAFIKGLDRQMWVLTPQTPNAHAAGGSLASDLRNDWSRYPFINQLVSAAIVNRYNVYTKSWNFNINPTLAGTFGAGAGMTFAPSRGLQGTIAAGSTTTVIPTSTSITSVGANTLANRGGSGEYGFKIRVIGLAAGKTEERHIIANSSGTTPTFVLSSPLTFTPALNDQYEILGGRYFMLGAGTTASGTWKSYEVAANTLATLSNTNLPGTIGTDSCFAVLDEQYVPYDNEPGEGFIKGGYLYSSGVTNLYALTASTTAAGSITGQASGGDSSVAANEFRNFQIRIVEDLTTPASVGQRRIIASHTAGPSAVYTLGTNWTTQPSSSCKFVIEYPNLIILRTSAQSTQYTYNYGTAAVNNGTNTINADAWSTTYFAAGNAHAAGSNMMAAFSIEPDTPQKYSRNSFIYSFRGGGVTTLDLFDIAGSITGLWSSNITYDGGVTIAGGSCGSHGIQDNDGRFFYINSYGQNTINQIFRFDLKNRVLAPFTPTEFLQINAGVVGNRFATYLAINGTEKYTMLFLMSMAAPITQELVVQT